MRFTISREKLQEGLAAVASAVPSKTTLPVLANLPRPDYGEGNSYFRHGSRYRSQYRSHGGYRSAGAITIPARKLSEIARELPTGAREDLRCRRSANHARVRSIEIQASRIAQERVPEFPGSEVRQGAANPVRRPAETHFAHGVRGLDGREPARSSTACCGSCGPNTCEWSRRTATASRRWTFR